MHDDALGSGGSEVLPRRPVWPPAGPVDQSVSKLWMTAAGRRASIRFSAGARRGRPDGHLCLQARGLPALLLLLGLLFAGCMSGGSRSDGMQTADAPFTLRVLDVGQPTCPFPCPCRDVTLFPRPRVGTWTRQAPRRSAMAARTRRVVRSARRSSTDRSFRCRIAFPLPSRRSASPSDVPWKKPRLTWLENGIRYA